MENAFRESKELHEKKKFIRKVSRKQFRTQFAIRRQKRDQMDKDKNKNQYINWLRGHESEDDDF